MSTTNPTERTAMDVMVDRFLSWPLPKSVCADLVATMGGTAGRSGTSLLTADEARQMLEYVCNSQEVYRATTGQQWPRELQACRSPYCECEPGECMHPGCYDARATSTVRVSPDADR